MYVKALKANKKEIAVQTIKYFFRSVKTQTDNSLLFEATQNTKSEENNNQSAEDLNPMGCPTYLQYQNYPVKSPKPDDKDPDEAENGNSDCEYCGIPSDDSSDYSPVSPASMGESIDSDYEDADMPTPGEKKNVFESELDKL